MKIEDRLGACAIVYSVKDDKVLMGLRSDTHKWSFAGGKAEKEDNNNLFLLEILSNVLQIASYIMLQKDSSNNDIMKELQVQDQTLSEQTNIYLKNIIRQNEEILEKLNNKTSS